MPQQTIAKIAPDPAQALTAYVLAFCALILLYSVAARQARGHHRAAAWAAVLFWAVALNAALLGLYPVDSADVFDNIIRGRMLALHGASPFYHTPAQFPEDPFYAFAAWKRFPTAYGPLWELTAAGAARLANAWGRASPIVGHVLTFKLVGVLAYAGTAALIGLHLRRTAPERALRGVLLFAWNPLVLYVTAGNGHNDALMAFFVVLGFVWLARGRATLAVLAMTAGALIKFVPALLLPVVVVAELKRLPSRRARGRTLLRLGLAGGLLAAGFYAPFWRGGDPLGVGRRSGLFTTSLPALLRWTLEPSLGKGTAQALAIGGAVAALMALVGLAIVGLVAEPGRHGRRVGRPFGADVLPVGELPVASALVRPVAGGPRPLHHGSVRVGQVLAALSAGSARCPDLGAGLARRRGDLTLWRGRPGEPPAGEAWVRVPVSFPAGRILGDRQRHPRPSPRPIDESPRVSAVWSCSIG